MKKKPARKSRDGHSKTLAPRASAQADPIKPDEIHDVLNCVAAGVFKISRDGRIVYVNAHGRQLLDMPDRDPVGVSLKEFEPFTMREDGSPLAYDDYPAVKCLRTGELQTGDTIGLRLPGGRVLWLSVTAVPLLDPATGKPESVITTLVDSSQPKHVEESLRQSEERYRSLVERAPDAIVVHRRGAIVFINDAFVRLYGGRAREDFMGRRVLDFIDPRDRDKARRRIRRAQAGEATPLIVQRHLRADGRTLHIEVTATPCIFRGQRCVQVICRDVTERRRAHRALRRAKAELEQRVAERTAELSAKNAELLNKQRFMERMLAVQEGDRKLVAYEIHDSILQDVIGAVMLLDTNYERLDPASENARRLELARGMLRKCIDEARRMITGLRPLIIDEQGIIGGIEYLAGEFARRGLEVRFAHAMQAERLAPELESTVFRIVQEALNNVERHSGCSVADVSIAQLDGRLRVEVRDGGSGFDPQTLGAGHFGLEGITERARLAGGSASIKSAPGKGTRVTVELPVVTVAVGASGNAKSS